MSKPKWEVPYVDLGAEFLARQDRYIRRLVDVCADARFILRQEVEELETDLAAYLGANNCVGVGSGSDALLLALQALELRPGDEVITVAHTFVATLAAIHFAGGTPVLVDIGADFNIDPIAAANAITPRTRALIAVHMNGRCCDMPALRAPCADRGIVIIEDAAQAIGARVDGIAAGAHGLLGCFSFHPMKTLHCFGDGGLVSTSDPAMAETIRLLRNHGQRTRTDLVRYGYNSRLDNLQAAILLENLTVLDEDIRRKRQIADRYQAALGSASYLTLPKGTDDPRFFDTYTSYVIQVDARKREALREHLIAQRVEVFVHGDPPLHQQANLGLKFELPNNERMSKRILSLPIFPAMTDPQIDYVAGAIRSFFERS